MTPIKTFASCFHYTKLISKLIWVFESVSQCTNTGSHSLKGPARIVLSAYLPSSVSHSLRLYHLNRVETLREEGGNTENKQCSLIIKVKYRGVTIKQPSHSIMENISCIPFPEAAGLSTDEVYSIKSCFKQMGRG